MRFLPAIFLFCAFTACSQSKKPEKEISDHIASLIKPGSPGVTVAVAKGGNILFSKGYGSANPEYDIPNTPQTIFHVASVSKQFTAFAIALLHDQGKISLDDDIRKHLPELYDFGHKITIRHLVHHTSGLRDQWNLLALAGWRLDDVITRDQVLQLMTHQRELNFKPGEQFSYCNTGYTLMGEIVSRVTGKTFAEWCRENIFLPLEMNNTQFYDDHEKIVKNRAYSFNDSPEGLKKSVLSYANAGATSLFTTAEDLTRWSNNFYTKKVGNAVVMNVMEERGILLSGDTLSYAFGQDLSTYRGLKTVSHSGGNAGYRSFLLRFPQHQYSIVVLSNLGSFNPGGLAYKIADIYLRDYLKAEPEKKEPKKDNAEKAAAGKIKLSEELLKMYEGQFRLNNDMMLTFKTNNGNLSVQPSGQPAVDLEARSESEFVIDAYNVKIVFNKTADNKVEQLTFSQGAFTTVAPRIQPFDAKTLDMKNYTGTFYSDELQTSYTLSIEKNALVARHIRHKPSHFTAVGQDTFTTDAWFMSKIDFVRNEKFEVIGFKVSSGRVKNVYFAKK